MHTESLKDESEVLVHEYTCFGGVPELHRTVLQYMLFAPSTTLFCVHFCQPVPLLVVDFQV